MNKLIIISLVGLMTIVGLAAARGGPVEEEEVSAEAFAEVEEFPQDDNSEGNGMSFRKGGSRPASGVHHRPGHHAPDHYKPEHNKPEHHKPEHHKPEHHKPGRHGHHEPEHHKPEHHKPGHHEPEHHEPEQYEPEQQSRISWFHPPQGRSYENQGRAGHGHGHKHGHEHEHEHDHEHEYGHRHGFGHGPVEHGHKLVCKYE